MNKYEAECVTKAHLVGMIHSKEQFVNNAPVGGA